jgi:imidazoleglycerol phosphate dehydratase HisB
MVESLFKALGKSIKEAYSIAEDLQSTKGTLTA